MQEFDVEINDKKGIKNLVKDHFSRLETHCKEVQINDIFPHDQLLNISDSSLTPWFADYVKYLVAKVFHHNSHINGRRSFSPT